MGNDLAPAAKRAAERAGLKEPERVTPYCLRHSFATALLKQGATLHETARLMRHSPVMTLTIYGHADDAGMREAASRLVRGEAENSASGTGKWPWAVGFGFEAHG